MEHVGREIFWNVGQTARWFAYALMVISFILIYLRHSGPGTGCGK